LKTIAEDDRRLRRAERRDVEHALLDDVVRLSGLPN
jgi:hypothetical protein